MLIDGAHGKRKHRRLGEPGLVDIGGAGMGDESAVFLEVKHCRNKFFSQFQIQMAHAEGVTTCLDTAAGVFERGNADIVRLIEESDTVLLDIKAFDPKLHREITGSDNAHVLDCARFLAERGKRIWVRRVLVPGLTDSEDDLKKTGDFIRSLGNVEKVEVLPYHDFGAPKWEALGLGYALKGAAPPTAEEVERARAILA